MRFQVDAEFLARYDVQTVGASMHQEYWIPAGDLDEFNRHIVGEIEVVAVFREQGERNTDAGDPTQYCDSGRNKGSYQT